MFDVDWMGLVCRSVLRERTEALVAEACAWAVGLSDRPHVLRHRGRLVETGGTLADRVGTGQQLGGEEDGRLELAGALPGSFADALNSVGPDGEICADRFDRELLEPFVRDVCVRAAQRASDVRPVAWAELLDDLGEDGDDLGAVVRAGEWEQPLRTEAEHLVLAALGEVPLLHVEAEGLPLSLVRRAEALTREAAEDAAPSGGHAAPPAEDGALFLARTALAAAGADAPWRPAEAGRLLALLAAEGLEPDEVAIVLPHLPLAPGTADAALALLARRP